MGGKLGEMGGKLGEMGVSVPFGGQNRSIYLFPPYFYYLCTINPKGNHYGTEKRTYQPVQYLNESRYDFDPIEKRCIYAIIQKVERTISRGKQPFNNMHKTSTASLQIVDEKHTKAGKPASG